MMVDILLSFKCLKLFNMYRMLKKHKHTIHFSTNNNHYSYNESKEIKIMNIILTFQSIRDIKYIEYEICKHYF